MCGTSWAFRIAFRLGPERMVSSWHSDCVIRLSKSSNFSVKDCQSGMISIHRTNFGTHTTHYQFQIRKHVNSCHLHMPHPKIDPSLPLIHWIPATRCHGATLATVGAMSHAKRVLWQVGAWRLNQTSHGNQHKSAVSMCFNAISKHARRKVQVDS